MRQRELVDRYSCAVNCSIHLHVLAKKAGVYSVGLTVTDHCPCPYRALMGAALFIISVIVGTILMVSPTKTYNISETPHNL